MVMGVSAISALVAYAPSCMNFRGRGVFFGVSKFQHDFRLEGLLIAIFQVLLFIGGSPLSATRPMNLIDVQIMREGERFLARGPELQIELPPVRGSRAAGKGEVIAGVRPEEITLLLGAATSIEGTLGEAFVVEPLGRDNLVDVRIDDLYLFVLADPRQHFQIGDPLRLKFDSDKVQLFDPETELSLLWTLVMLKQRCFIASALAVKAHLAALLFAIFLLSACSAPRLPGFSDRISQQESANDVPTELRGPLIETVLTGLSNPRGVAVLPDGSLMVAEGGTGYNAVDSQEWTGRLTHFQDTNHDGDFEDEGEHSIWFRHLPTYNMLQEYSTWRDEVGGPGDLLRHPDGHLYLTVDGGHGRIGLYEISPYKRMGRNLSARGNMNGLAFSRDHAQIYIAESTANALSVVNIADAAHQKVTQFGALASGQQSVPAGVAVDPRNGGLLIALFSGALVIEGEKLPVIPGDSAVVRVDPDNGVITDAVIGLTTAIEMCNGHADLIEPSHDLFDPDQTPLHGGYLRFSGRVTVYPPPAEADAPPYQAAVDATVLADGLDMPTNITLAPDGSLYISTGQGTPNRPIPGPDGPTRIVGEVVRITLPDANSR